MNILISFGLYPNADIELFKNTTPINIPVLIMDNYNKDFVTQLQEYVPIKRYFMPDDQQIDFSITPAQNAIKLFKALTSDSNFHLYKYCVGWNEVFTTKEHYAFIADCEVILCGMLHGLGMKYLWGSINVGNIEPDEFITIFKDINNIADGVNYHGYLPPNTVHVSSDTNDDYVGRPYKWWKKCQEVGVNFPELFFGESGTYYPWKNVLTAAQYQNVLIDINDLLRTWQHEGMPILGHNAFALGAEGSMGTQWNMTDTSIIKDYNNMSVPVPLPPVQVIQGNGAWIWYKSLSPNLFADLKRNNFQWLSVKYSDGNGFGDKFNSEVFQKQFKLLIQPLHDLSYKVYAYAYLYLDDPIGEATCIAQAVLQDKADGIILDAEYESVNKFKQAQLFFDTLWSLIPRETLVCYSPDFRILEGNTYLPWRSNLSAEPWPWEIFNKNCKYVMPQLYWTDFQVTPAIAFDLIDIYKNTFPNAPEIIPVFPSDASASELLVALEYSNKYQFSGCSIWRFDDLTPALSKVLNNIWVNNLTDAELVLIGKKIFSSTNVPFNPDAALLKAWITSWRAGKYLGLPLGSEFVAGRYTCQQFEYDVCWAETGNWGNFGTGVK